MAKGTRTENELRVDDDDARIIKKKDTDNLDGVKNDSDESSDPRIKEESYSPSSDAEIIRNIHSHIVSVYREFPRRTIAIIRYYAE